MYVGVDVGGTKILAALTTPRGAVLARERTPTPRQSNPKEIVGAVIEAIRNVLESGGVSARQIAAIGLAVPGIVGPDQEEVVFAPNLNISGVNLVGPLKKEFHVPAVLGNDVNLGTLGEKWLGAARQARSAVGMFIGTGIGGGIIHQGRLILGQAGTAAEIGHMIMQIDGPRCGCGLRGCLEAMASRTAIERDLRAALDAGRKTILADLVGRHPKVIKSSVLQEALHKKDPLVCEVMTRASEVLGYACLNLRHLLDPGVIILGGGVIEACGFFVLPIVRRIVDEDPLLAKMPKIKVQASELGDDAVVLGAVALAQQSLGRNPFKLAPPVAEYPIISQIGAGQIKIGGQTFREDVIIRANGTVKMRNKVLAKIGCEHADTVCAKELQKVCKGNPNVLVVAAKSRDKVVLGPDAQDFLRKRNIRLETPSARDADKVYNKITTAKAALIRLWE
jgi:glucokinase